MNDAAIMARLMGCDARLLLKHRDGKARKLLAELHCSRETYDAASDYDDISIKSYGQFRGTIKNGFRPAGV